MFDFEKAKQHFSAKMAFTTGPFELDGMMKRGEDVVIIDVRQPSDFRAGHIPGAINLPNGKWHTARGLRRDALNVVYCYSQTCRLAAGAALELARQGYPVMEMEGGYDAWLNSQLPAEVEERAVV